MQGWLPLILLPTAAFLLIPRHWPAWALMWALVVAFFAGCKWLSWRRRRVASAPAWKHLAYLLAWPGLDADAFLGDATAPKAIEPAATEWAFAIGKLILGAALLFGGARLLPPDWPYIAGWVGMIGMVMMLHFGLFHLISCAWRSGGVEARPLMDWPVASAGVGEFWGRRWNRAFPDLANRVLFRPFVPALGLRGAAFVGFAFSGVVHDIVISVPAGAGYGGPTLYFLIQAAGLALERSAGGRKIGLGRGGRGRLFAVLVVLAPVVLLFHPPFVNRVIVPFMHAIGAL